MDNNTNIVDNQYLLNVPLAYVLQNKTIEDISNIYDEYGWNVLHHSVATLNVPKIKELLHFNFDYSLNSKKNYIPTEAYMEIDKRTVDSDEPTLNMLNKIPFCIDGFTPMHLVMFFIARYAAHSGQFFYQNISGKYMSILNMFSEKQDWLDILDSNGFSLFDYALLLEDIHLIEYIHMSDPEFKTLKKILPKTALKILEIIELKQKNKMYQELSNHHVSDLLRKKILKEELKMELPLNKNKKEKTINKL